MLRGISDGFVSHCKTLDSMLLFPAGGRACSLRHDWSGSDNSLNVFFFSSSFNFSPPSGRRRLSRAATFGAPFPAIQAIDSRPA
ncbi:hypothetical protein M441DRAFT_230494 [Trichoderma asperellum CBS 433.97]|uniref:Uncharacterized protein n=1 Tax=Trichoderma asperellum (strain ATCC 204424 / CBS 433.97 / NBRC 101777) TaxID=1042311 RepID=A0A2T3ZQK6_TRIA4|nr:hypothetical protein M441DRAFT_230494 [Trichoderma asperellum CBS 433.97]PTB47079.1 hypothetical protein M441DRAFT_230494 [Trichoderma asperellum CBS 433.97]